MTTMTNNKTAQEQTSEKVKDIFDKLLDFPEINLSDEQRKRAEEQGAQLFLLIREYFTGDGYRDMGRTRLWDINIANLICALIAYIQDDNKEGLAVFQEGAAKLRLLCNEKK